jgi:hypothetical protein
VILLLTYLCIFAFPGVFRNREKWMEGNMDAIEKRTGGLNYIVV